MGILDKLTKEDLFMSESDALKWEEWEKNTIYKDGIEQGIEQNTKDVILNMLHKNISLEDIRDVTGKSIEEIKKIKEEINL